MMQLTLIGYLGGNSERKKTNNEEYLQFRVSNTRRWRDELGNTHETTDWVTCFLRGKFEGIEPYLLKGQLVYVAGIPSVRAYPSEKERKYIAGISLSVDKVELLGKSVKVSQSQSNEAGEEQQAEQNRDVVY